MELVRKLVPTFILVMTIYSLFAEVDVSVAKRHEEWMARHRRVCKNNKEKAVRFKIFVENIKFIESFNTQGNHSYKLGVNQFTDMTDEEFRATQNGFRAPFRLSPSSTGRFSYENVTAIPTTVDWRGERAVTKIKDQGVSCGSCWAFLAIATVERIHKIKAGKLIMLSEQQLVDCNTKGIDHGCNGGFVDQAFDFILKNRGLATESEYPYDGKDSDCNFEKAASRAATITGYEQVPANDESALMKAVAHQPVSVGIDSDTLNADKSGVYTGDCGTNLVHAVTVVGYGTTEEGTKYWLTKNSWGVYWGEEGYLRLERGIHAKEGKCGIAMTAYYPTAKVESSGLNRRQSHRAIVSLSIFLISLLEILIDFVLY